MSLSSARLIDDAQVFLDALTGGASIEYDSADGEDGGVLDMIILMTVECPHCGETFRVEHDPQADDEEFD